MIDVNTTSAGGDRDVLSGYGELFVPLIARDMEIPAVSSLELQLALRGEHYSDFGATVNPKIALGWRPAGDWLLLRGSYSHGFRAPALVQLFAGSLTFSQELQDTRRFLVTGDPIDESSPLQVLAGGNPNLDPETSRNYSAGFVLSPQFVPGLSLSADFFRIEVEEAIASLDPQFILDNEADFPGLVQRAPPSAGDQMLGLPGPVLSINTSFQNLGRVEVQGADFGLEYAFPETPLGNFALRLDLAYLDSFRQQGSSAEAPRELAGTYVRPKIRGRGEIIWGFRGFEARGAVNYTDSYVDETGDRRVDSNNTVDLLVGYTFRKNRVSEEAPATGKEIVTPAAPSASGISWLDDFAIRVGVRNVFDDPPPFANNTAGYPVQLEDPRQRFIFVDLEKKF